EDAVRQARAAYQAQARAMAAATRGLAPSAAVQVAPVQATAVQAAGGQACQPGQNPAQADAGQDLLDGGPLTLGEPVAETGEDWQAASAGLADLVEQAFRTSQPGADKAPEQGGAKHG
ncbi:MAG: hypothetical protein K6C33_11120, partial [Desulfovibrio sp.]|nr:hypothetical protein [Desulfovibrio sp.]